MKAENLDYFGNGFGENFDATGTYTYVHINYYATTATEFNFSLVDDSLSATVCCGNSEEPFYKFGPNGDEPLVQNSWQSVFIPLSHFANYPALVSGTWDGTDLKQTLFTGNGLIYIDNIYFSTSNTLGLDNFTSSDFNLFPNPTQDNWKIKSTKVIYSVEVYDILGKQVLSLNPKSTEVEIDARNLKSGLYFAKVNAQEESSTLKLVRK